MLNIGMLTSNSEEWSTPQKLFDELNKEFLFTLDPCFIKGRVHFNNSKNAAPFPSMIVVMK